MINPQDILWHGAILLIIITFCETFFSEIMRSFMIIMGLIREKIVTLNTHHYLKRHMHHPNIRKSVFEWVGNMQDIKQDFIGTGQLIPPRSMTDFREVLSKLFNFSQKWCCIRKAMAYRQVKQMFFIIHWQIISRYQHANCMQLVKMYHRSLLHQNLRNCRETIIRSNTFF